MGKYLQEKNKAGLSRRTSELVRSSVKNIVQVQEVKNIETEEIEMNEISSKSLDISISDPEGTYPRPEPSCSGPNRP